MKNILVVDDDRIVLESCRRSLEGEGFNIVTRNSVVEALQILEEECFDMLLVDVIMPEHDGIYLIGKVRGRWPLIRVIIMSGYPTQEVIARGEKAGAVGFVAKPFNPDELLEAVQAALDIQ